MTIANAATMTNRHWVEGDGLPPGFYYPAVVRPHLHLCPPYSALWRRPNLASLED